MPVVLAADFSRPGVKSPAMRLGGWLFVLGLALLILPVDDQQWVQTIAVVQWSCIILGALLASGVTRLLVRDSPDGPRIEMTPERIVLFVQAGVGREWVRSEGDLVQVKGRGRRQHLKIGQGTIELTALQLRAFDLAAVKAACISLGWSWQEGRAGALTAYSSPTSNPAVEPEVTLELRTGFLRSRRLKRAAYIAIFSSWVGLAAAGAVFDAYAMPSSLFVLMTAPLFLAAVGLVFFLITLTMRETLTISPSRLRPKNAEKMIHVSRAYTEQVRIGRRFMSVRGINGRLLMVMSLHGRADEVAEHLRANGWPVVRT